MKLKPDTQLTTFRGEPLRASEDESIITVRKVAQEALLAPLEDAKDGQTKYRRWKLAERLEGENITLTAEELSEIKECVGKAYAAAVVGPFFEAVEKCE